MNNDDDRDPATLIEELLGLIYDKIDDSSFTIGQIVPQLRQALLDDMNEAIFD